jgi:hypothetical protein
MKRLILTAAAVLLLGTAAVAVAAEAGYWDRFKSVFVDWDDNAPPASGKTQVTGVRGVNVEKALGKKGYDWDAVNYMEDFTVSMDSERSFLEEGKLGPFAKGVK